MPATRVSEHLARFGLECKDLEWLEDGAQVLGLAFAMEHGKLRWKGGSMVPDTPDIVTQWAVFFLCERLVRHFLVCGWLRVACGVFKRRASSVTKGWDDETRDNLLQHMISKTVDSVWQDNPAHGDWCVDGRELNVWVDASTLTIGVALERHETVLQDACWVRNENDTQHINLAELDTVLKSINLALQWQCKVLHLKTDSVCVHHWVLDTLTGRTWVCTKATTEMFIRRRLNTQKKLVEEYELTVDVVLVLSNKNIVNQLTRVPQSWFTTMKMENGPKPLIGAIYMDELDADQIMAIHRSSGHLGVQRTTYFIRRICPVTPRVTIKMAIRMCEECQSIDPAPVHWEKGTLEVDDNWQRVGMDIMHYGAHNFLTVTDCGPTHFSIWRQLARQDSVSVIRQLETVFFECGPPHELLTDNNTPFCSREFWTFANDWGVNMRFRCAYVLAGNGIAEQCHHMVKHIAARMHCPIQEAVYWHNVMSRDSMSSLLCPPTRSIIMRWG